MFKFVNFFLPLLIFFHDEIQIFNDKNLMMKVYKIVDSWRFSEKQGEKWCREKSLREKSVRFSRHFHIKIYF